MVKNSIRVALTFLMISHVNVKHAVAESLHLEHKTNSVEIGRPLVTEIYAINIKKDLSTIDLTPLKKHFGIVIDYSAFNTIDKRWPTKKIQVLGLKLYPRQTGKLTIPALQHDGFSTDQSSIDITEGKSSSPSLTISAKQIYARQQFYIYVNYTSNESTSRLEPGIEEKIDGFEIQPLGFERTKLDNKLYQLSTGWSVSTLNPGNKTLDLPPVVYSVSSIQRKRFYFPTLDLQIKAVPGYLSPTLPIGEFIITEATHPAYFATTNKLYYWKIHVSGHVNQAFQLPSISRFLKNTDSITFLPTSKEITKEVNHRQYLTRITYTIPYKLTTNGLTSLPDIGVPFFDPDISKVVETTLLAVQVLSLSPFWRALLVFILITILFFISRYAYIKLKALNFKFKNKQRAYYLLENATSYQGIREALRFYSSAKFDCDNFSINWFGQKIIQSGTGVNKEKVKRVFNEINRGLYSAQAESSATHNANQTANELLLLLRNTRKFNLK